MNKQNKKQIRAEFALKTISEPVILNQKLLREQINTLSSLTRITNDKIGDNLIGAEQVLELFEWLPKGIYDVKIKIV